MNNQNEQTYLKVATKSGLILCVIVFLISFIPLIGISIDALLLVPSALLFGRDVLLYSISEYDAKLTTLGIVLLTLTTFLLGAFLGILNNYLKKHFGTMGRLTMIFITFIILVVIIFTIEDYMD